MKMLKMVPLGRRQLWDKIMFVLWGRCQLWDKIMFVLWGRCQLRGKIKFVHYLGQYGQEHQALERR